MIGLRAFCRAVVCALGLGLSLTAQAQLVPGGAYTSPDALADAAARAFEDAVAALDRAQSDTASTRIAALTQAIRAYEDGLAALRAGQRQAAQRAQTLEAVMVSQQDGLSRLLSVLMAIERAPRPALVLHPEGPLAGARAGMTLSAVTPSVGRDVANLRAALEELTLMRDIQSGAQARLQDGLAGMQDARQRLAQAVADRGPLPVPVAQDAQAMQRLLQSADTLDAFASGLAGLPAAAPPNAQTAGQQPLPWPVRGVLLRAFWEVDAVGIARPGWLIATEPGALVTTPFAATARYVGPLLDFGRVVVLEPSNATLVILAGLGTTYVQTGAVLPKGAPLGLMPQTRAGQADVSGVGRAETLYMETRLGGQPVDPADWFAAGAGGTVRAAAPKDTD